MIGFNGIRFAGIASGLDTENIIKQLMQVERTKVERYIQQKQILEWKRDDYREINTKLLALRNSAWDLNLASTFRTKKLSSSDENRLTCTASGGAIEGNYEIVIKQLARGVSQEYSYASDTGIVDDKLVAGGTFKLNGVEIALEAGDSLATIAKKINEVAAETNVKATYDVDKKLFYFITTNTGSDARISITESEFSEVSFLDNFISASGQNAVITFNGGSDIEFSSNQFTFNNMIFNLKKADPATTINISVENDLDAIVDKIKAFVNDYNAIMEKIDTKLKEKRYRDFPPLTDEQKEEMKESDITKWEEKARSGLFRGDTLLSGIYSSIRMTTSSAIEGEGQYRTLSSVGIGTIAWYDQGKLHIDEEKLRTALTEDLDGVIKLFTATEEADGTDGIATRLCDKLDECMKSITDRAGSSTSVVDRSYLGRELEDVNERIAYMEEYLFKVEERYWAQFTAMETALQRMQSQSAYLVSLMGS